MVKLVLSLSLLSVSAWAESEVCNIKMKNAASYELAQLIVASVQQITVVSMDPVSWTKAARNNTGVTTITVKGPARALPALVTKTYLVNAKQIGNTEDCDIHGVVELAQGNL